MVNRRQFLTGALLATVSISACSGKQEGGSSGRFSFTYLRPTWGPATYTKNGPFEKELERRAGVSIDVQIIPVIDYDTKVNTILASGDIPDVIWGSGPTSGTWRSAQDEGAFLPIDDYLDKYPAVRKAVPDSIWKMLRDDKGDTYFVPNLIWPQVPFFLYYRKDLFDKAGIAEPASLEEFQATLEQVKKAYPKMVPFTMGYEWHAKEIATSFGTGMFGWEPAPDDPDTLAPWFMKEKEIDLYFWLQDLHKKGLLDPDYGVSKEPNFSTAKLKADKAVMAIEHWGAYTSIVTELRTIRSDGAVSVVSPLGETAGSRAVFPVDRGFYVSAKIKDPDGFFAFLNWTLTEGSELRRWGVEGKTYKVENGTKVSLQDAERPKSYQGPQIEPLGFIGPFSEKLDWDGMRTNFEGAGIGKDFDYIKGKFDDYTRQEYFDYRDPTVVSPTDAKKGTQLFEDNLQKVAQSTIVNHKVTRAEWAAAVEKWKRAGGNAILEEVNSLQKDKSKPEYTTG
ncbi:extracellular solute-binding protein [Actinopolymorpha alba]|uniref:extracellular solute-binding protein n=1 Tax=Actinopolymorpha alba TaxID=533267 RepID=UPI00035FCBB6|nr:extracellular solute-binding protein [Actinopolymorpha alba]